MNITQFLELCKVFGISVPSNPAGAMTAEQIITALDASIGNGWKQGVNGAVVVRDFGADSADLAPYLNVDGKWHLPDGAIIFVDTQYLTIESAFGRTVYMEGDLFLFSYNTASRASIGSDASVATLADGCFENENNGSLSICGVTPLSLDADTPFINAIAGDTLNIDNSTGNCAVANWGTLGFDSISMNVGAMLIQTVPGIVGADCTRFYISPGTTYLPFFGSNVGFDLTTPPTSGSREVIVRQSVGCPGGEPFITIDTDDGKNRGAFIGCTRASGDAGFIAAEDDPDFEENSLLSLNWSFQALPNHPNTIRLGECYFAGSQVIAIADADTWTDLYEAAIAEGNLSNGIRMTANPGEFEYVSETPGLVRVSANVQGQPTSGSPEYLIGAFFKPAAGAYAQVTKGGFNIEQDGDQSGNGVIHVDFEYTLRMEQGDMFKIMVKDTGGTQDFTLHNFSHIAEVLS